MAADQPVRQSLDKGVNLPHATSGQGKFSSPVEGSPLSLRDALAVIWDVDLGEVAR
jgi:hypothetical protein